MDSTNITRVLTHTEVSSEEEARINNFVGGSSYDDPQYKNWKHKKHKWTYTSLPLDEKKNRLVIGYGYAQKKMRATFQFNPSQLNTAAFLQLRAHIDPLLNGGLVSLLCQSRINHVEVAVDIDGAQFHDYVFVDARIRTTNGSYEELGTTYMGAKTSRRKLRIYDKRKQLIEMEDITLDDDRLRIEAILDKPLCSVPQLPLLSNPFATLIVVERKALLDNISDPVVAMFVTHMIEGKLTAQQAYVSSTNRQQLRQVLHAIQPMWYVPDKFWAGAADAVKWVDQFGSCNQYQ